MDEKDTNKRKYNWKSSVGNTSKQYLIIYFFVIVIIYIAVFALALILNIRTKYFSNIDFFLNDISLSIQSNIINEVNYQKWCLDNFSSEITSGKEKIDDESIRQILATKKNSTNFDLIVYYDVEGRYITSNDSLLNVNEIINNVKHGKKEFTFINDRSALFYVPVIKDNEVLGTLCGILSSENFASIISELRISSVEVNILLLLDSVPMLITDANGEIVTSSVQNLNSSDIDGIINIRDLIKHENSGSSIVKISGRSVFVSFIKVANSDVTILTAIPSFMQNANINFYYISLLIMGIALIALFIIFISIIIISSKKRMHMMVDTAYFDQITGGLNNAGLLYQAPLVIKKAEDYALVRLSIREFSVYTSIFGSLEGNNILKSVMQVIDSRLSSDELISRAYAENFILLMKRGDKEVFEKRIDFFSNCAESIYNENMAQAYKINISFACGIYFLNSDDDVADLSVLLEKVRLVHEVALNDDRQCNIIKYYDDKLLSKVQEEKEYIDNFHIALENRDFLIYYQPKVDCTTHRIFGAEALVRMKNGNQILPPGKFIPVYEKNGYIIQLDLYVFEEVCAAIRNLIVLGENVVPVSVNLSARHFAHEGIAEELERIRSSYSVPASLLEIEVTESIFFDKKSLEIVKEEFTKLHNYGFTCSLDDFGSGYSSLSLLMGFDINFLKIDKSFIDNIFNEKTKIILKSIIDLALSLNIGLIAEGVETEEQLEIVHNMGCNIIQGYIYSKPLSFDDWINYHKSFGGGQVIKI